MCVIAVITPKMSSKTRNNTNTGRNLLNAPKHVNRKNLIFNILSDEEDNAEPNTKLMEVTPCKPVTKTPNKFFKSARKKPPGSVRKKENAENNNILDSLQADWNDTLPSLVLKVPNDLPLSSLNSTSHCPSQPEGERLGPPAPVRSTSKTRNKVAQRTRTSKSITSRGRGVTSLSQSPEDVKPEEESAHSRSRNRMAKGATLSSSKAKLVTESKPATRTRASRSLRLI